jgi:hypothetical protein
MQDTPAARRWRALVEEHAASGLTNKAFAAKKKINPRTLVWWRSHLKKADAARQLPVPKPAFTEVVVAQPDRTVVLALDDFGAHVVVDHDTDLGLLRRVLEAVA